jgi:hypothetical protein
MILAGVRIEVIISFLNLSFRANEIYFSLMYNQIVANTALF